MSSESNNFTALLTSSSGVANAVGEKRHKNNMEYHIELAYFVCIMLSFCLEQNT
jgi:hypothetical protein